MSGAFSRVSFDTERALLRGLMESTTDQISFKDLGRPFHAVERQQGAEA